MNLTETPVEDTVDEIAEDRTPDERLIDRAQRSRTAKPILTMGHSTHSLPAFITILEDHAVNRVVDLRSYPYSRHAPQFNQQPLAQALHRAAIAYDHEGEYLGGRPRRVSMYDAGGQVDYLKMAEDSHFHGAIKKLARQAMNEKVLLLCTEHDPLQCHRTVLVARTLHEQGIALSHILRSGKIEDHRQTVNRMLRGQGHATALAGTPAEQLEELVAEAWREQGKAIAYRKPSPGRASYK